MSAPAKKKGSASVGALPSRVQPNHAKDQEMNKGENSTFGADLNAWAKVRRLTRELSAALAEVDDADWYATVYPEGHADHVIFMAVIAEHRP